jgi:phosphinothricin acetyltransferase
VDARHKAGHDEPSIPMPLSIRAAGPTDIPAIARIYDHAVRHGTASFEIAPPDEAEMARRIRALLEGGYPHLVAERDGAVLGYAYAGPYRARPAYRWAVEDSIYVDPTAYRRGIGRALLDRLIAESTVRDFRQMIAVIGDSAQTASIELHRAAGFRLVGTIENVGFKFGRWLDSVIMQRALGPGAATKP